MKLTHGPGTPDTGGCWMVAVQRYTEHGGWHDQPECVCPIIRALCIKINDWLPDGDRERVIGPHLFAPVGTRNAALLPVRMRRVVQFALDQAGVKFVLPEVALLEDYQAAESAAWAAAGAAAGAARAAAWAAESAAGAAEAAAGAARAAAGAAAWAAAGAAWAAAGPAAEAGEAAEAAEAALLPLVLELCAMSTPTEVCPVRTREQVLAEVCKASA